MQCNQAVNSKILYVDLSTRAIYSEPIDEMLLSSFIGGFGINNALAYKFFTPGISPLSPQNAIVFGAGLLGGTPAPASSKLAATTKLPINNAIGTASGGGGGDALRRSGYGNIVVKGSSDTPVVLKVGKEVEILPAVDLWGKDIFFTTDEMRRKHGAHATVIAIGPAGENGLAFAMAFINKMSHLGRGGLGSVMGAKKLKAIVVQCSEKVSLAHPLAFAEIAHAIVNTLIGISYRDDWIKIGSAIAFWGRSDGWQRQVSDPYGPLEYMKLRRGSVACRSCPMPCKFSVEVEDENGDTLVAPVSGLGTAARIWRGFNVGSLKNALGLRIWCNRNGIDDLTLANLIDFVITLFEQGILTRRDTEGRDLRRDYSTVLWLATKILHREGLGELMADGIDKAAERIGRGAREYVISIKGQEPMFDPRLHFDAMSISQVVNPRGAYVMPGNSPAFVDGHPPGDFVRFLRRLGLLQDTIDRICTPSNVNMARLAKHTEDWYSVCSSLGVCLRQPVAQCYNVETAARLFEAATGIEMPAVELIRCGERAWNMLKAVNIREGFSRKDDRFPDSLLKPLEDDGELKALTDYYGAPLDRQAIDKLLDDYYEERGWDVKRGIPTAEKLSSLGLDEIAEELVKLGYDTKTL